MRKLVDVLAQVVFPSIPKHSDAFLILILLFDTFILLSSILDPFWSWTLIYFLHHYDTIYPLLFLASFLFSCYLPLILVHFQYPNSNRSKDLVCSSLISVKAWASMQYQVWRASYGSSGSGEEAICYQATSNEYKDSGLKVKLELFKYILLDYIQDQVATIKVSI